jgi:hypothetical protein
VRIRERGDNLGTRVGKGQAEMKAGGNCARSEGRRDEAKGKRATAVPPSDLGRNVCTCDRSRGDSGLGVGCQAVTVSYQQRPFNASWFRCFSKYLITYFPQYTQLQATMVSALR